MKTNQRGVKKLLRREVSRRRLLQTAGVGTIAFSMPMVLLPRKGRAAQQVIVTTPGGPYPEAYAEAFFKPFNEAMAGKIEIVNVTIPSNPTAECKAMVDNKTYQWDLVGLNGGASLLLAKAGYLEKAEVSDNPDVQEIPDQFKTPYMVGLDIYATVLAYRTDKYPAGGPQPTGGWPDLWNVTRFQGRRSLRKHPFDTLEVAVMADGVPASEVYPIDVDRAFRSLDKIKPDVKVWYADGAQATHLLSSNEVDLIPTWNGRIQPVIDSGAPVEISWNQGFHTWWGWNILKGNPKADACREVIKFAANAKRQSVIAKYMAYGPCNTNAYKYIDPKRGPYLPTYPENLAKMFAINSEFWAGAKDQAMQRFNEWIIS